MKKFLVILPVIGIFVFLLVPSALIGQWYLFAVFLSFGVCFMIVEIIAIIKTDRTVSGHIWELRKKNPKAMYIICGCIVIAIGLLLFHFLIQG